MGLFSGNRDRESVDRASSELLAGKVAEGLGGQIAVHGDWITIRRKGLLAKTQHGLAGEKRIPIANVTSVQLKMPGMTNGYIQFSLLGSSESKGGFTAASRDENSVVFTRNHVAEFVAIRDYVEARIANGIMRAEPTQGTVDVADELSKLAALRDRGILTDAEFAAQKAKLLS